jgi:hypothetical protein
MPIGEVLEKAFKYPWKQRALWFYGVLLAIFTAGSGISNQYQPKESDFKFLENINSNTLWITISIIILVSMILGFLGLIITSWSTAAISRGTAMLEDGKEITRKEIGKTGKRPIWKLIILNFFIPILIFIILLIIVSAFVALFYFLPQPAGLWIGVSVGAIAFFALIPLLVYWNYVWILATRYIVLADMNAFASLGEGKKLIKGRFWWTFLLGLVQGMITGAATFVAIIPLIIIVSIAVVLAVANIWFGVAILGILALVYLVVFIIAIGYFTAFRETAWTLWWLKLKDQANNTKITKKMTGSKKTVK